MAKWWHDNSLSIVLGASFVAILAGQVAAGFAVHNEELQQHGHAALGLLAYLESSHFLEALFENWESEFLQMGVFVLLIVFLHQRGSSESKPLDDHEEPSPPPKRGERPPWPVRRGGAWAKVYESSLSIALFALFVLSFLGHAFGGLGQFNAERLEHGQPSVGVIDYVSSSDFWFQSLQNWQSEFLAVLAMVVLSIFLRQRGSPQSKDVSAPHSQTG